MSAGWEMGGRAVGKEWEIGGRWVKKGGIGVGDV